MKSPRRHRSRWSHVNTPCGLRRRKAKIDARREALAATLPPVYAGPEPLSLWQSVQMLDGAGRVLHSIALYVPSEPSRCDQHAAMVDGVPCDKMLTATHLGRLVAGWVPKRPSAALLAEWRGDLLAGKT